MYKLRHPNLVPIYDSGMFQTLPGPGSGKGLNQFDNLLAIKYLHITTFSFIERLVKLCLTGKQRIRYIEMELLEGDLHGAIHARGVGPAFAAKILGNVVSGLRYLRDSHDMVHLDIKPANVFLTSGVAKLGDFGLCCSKAQAAALLGPCGTPEYLPGDVWHEEVRCSERNDIWGAGCMLNLG